MSQQHLGYLEFLACPEIQCYLAILLHLEYLGYLGYLARHWILQILQHLVILGRLVIQTCPEVPEYPAGLEVLVRPVLLEHLAIPVHHLILQIQQCLAYPELQ